MKKFLKKFIYFFLITLSVSLFAKGKTDKATSKNSNIEKEIIFAKRKPAATNKGKIPSKKNSPGTGTSENSSLKTQKKQST